KLSDFQNGVARHAKARIHSENSVAQFPLIGVSHAWIGELEAHAEPQRSQSQTRGADATPLATHHAPLTTHHYFTRFASRRRPPPPYLNGGRRFARAAGGSDLPVEVFSSGAPRHVDR